MRTLTLAACVLLLTEVHVRAQCLGDFNDDGKVAINEIITAVSNSLLGCPTPGARFVDNGDGTITDATTRLMWEKKSADGSIHDWTNAYIWADAFGTFVAQLNAGSGFAGHSDWRLPNVNELQSLADYGAVSPAIDQTFNTGCVPSCTVTSCSCTQASYYWSSTPYQLAPPSAWAVFFYAGQVLAPEQQFASYVRAVRAGL